MEELNESESEWEYEYDANDTETVYVTLDFTTHVAPTLPGKNNKSGKTPSTAQTREKIERQSQALDQADDTDLTTEQSEPAGRLQIVELHSEHPLIAYNNQLYTCYWATDVGTSVYISNPDENADHQHNPLRSFRSFDLLGVTSARLIGIPTTARPRDALLKTDEPPPYEPGPKEKAMETDHGDRIWMPAHGPLRIELPADAPPEKVSQARFLERLSAIKKERGQNDPVPIRSITQYQVPENWQTVRADWLAKERATRSNNKSMEGDDVNTTRGSRASTLREEGSEQPSPQKVKKKRGPTGKPNGRPRKIRVEEDEDVEGGQRAVSVDEEVDREEMSDEQTDDEDLEAGSTPQRDASVAESSTGAGDEAEREEEEDEDEDDDGVNMNQGRDEEEDEAVDNDDD